VRHEPDAADDAERDGAERDDAAMSRLDAARGSASAVAETTLRSASKVVTDRRWAVTATAMALGFGLFIGVAIGPGASGTLAGAAPGIVEVPASNGGTDEGDGGSGGATGAAAAPSAEAGATSEAPPEAEYASSAPYEPAPLEPLPVEPAPQTPPAEPAPEAPAPEEGEPEPEGQVLEGTVVHPNPAAGSYALAIRGGELVAVHAAKLPPVGAKLSLSVRQLANGTFAEEEKPENEGKASRAGFTGTVTFADSDPAAPAYTVSGRGASVLVRVEPDPSGAAPALPPLGSFATVEVRIGKPPASASALPPADAAAASVLPEAATTSALCDLGAGVQPAQSPKPPQSALWQQKLEVEDVEPSTYLEVAGLVSGICADRSALLLSADDARDGGDDLLLTISPKIDAGRLRAGDSVVATVEVAADGTFTLTGLAGDERTRGADDPRSAQGDLARH
jgi:hypothetical protein